MHLPAPPHIYYFIAFILLFFYIKCYTLIGDVMNKDYMPLIFFMIPILWIISIVLMIDYLVIGIILNIIVVLSTIYLIKRNSHSSRVVIDNIPNDIEEKYNIVFRDYILPLEKYRKKDKVKQIILYILLAICILLLILENLVGIYIFPVDTTFWALIGSTVILYFSSHKRKWKQGYAVKFKDNALASFIYSLNPNISYCHSVRKKNLIDSDTTAQSVSEMCRNNDLHAHYTTIDDELHFENSQTKLNLFNVLLEDKRRAGRKGPRTMHKVYNGLFGWGNINVANYYINSSIRIAPSVAFDTEGSTNVAIDNVHSESISVRSKDETLTKSIITPEIINYLSDIYEKSHLDFIITIKYNTIYYSFHTDRQTNVNVISKSQLKRHLLCYYYAIQIMNNTSSMINKNIQELSIKETKEDSFDDFFNSY